MNDRARAVGGQALGFISLWVYMNAAITALLGKQRAFGVTPKGTGVKIPWRHLWPQLGMLTLSLIAALIGVDKILESTDLAMLVNVFWTSYHSFLLGTIFYFNRPFSEYPKALVFRSSATP